MTGSTYEVRITVTDHQPGRARAKARAELIAAVMEADTLAAMAGNGLIERLAALGYSVNHAPEVSEVVSA